MTADSFKTWLDKWISPVTLTTVFGAIVWGVQLNAAVLKNAQTLAETKIEMATLLKANIAHSETLVRIGVLLDQLERRMAIVERHTSDHERESEEWKRQIIQNRTDIKRGTSGGH